MTGRVSDWVPSGQELVVALGVVVVERFSLNLAFSRLEKEFGVSSLKVESVESAPVVIPVWIS